MTPCASQVSPSWIFIFLHPAFGQDIVSRVTDILRNGVVQEGLAHLPDDVLLQICSCLLSAARFLGGLR